MPGRTYSSPSDISKAVERQMRNWELARAQRVRQPPPERKEVEEFVSISRAVGSGGREVAARLAERLAWPLFDKEILQAMAGDDDVRQRLYESMDERDLGWFEETIRSLTPDEFPRNDYFRRLCRTVLSVARQGSAVFLGRATDLILPKNRGLRVRIISLFELCVQSFAREHGLDLDAARKEVLRIEQERAEFTWNHFRVDVVDPARFDLTINLGRFTPDHAVDMIMSALSIRAIVP